MAGLSFALVTVLVAVLLVVWLAGDDDEPAPPAPPTAATASPAAASAVLADLERAVRDGDADAGEALADPDDPAARELARAIVENATRLRVDDFTLRYVDQDAGLGAGLPDDQFAAAVEMTWQFAGADPGTASTEVTFTFAAGDDRPTLVSAGGGDRRAPLWLTGPLEIDRTADTLVMVAGDRQELAEYAAYAREARRVVRRVLPQWRESLVVEVPATADDLDAMLGAEPGEYAAIAAVTATADGSVEPTAPAHVFVNPEVFGDLRPQGAQVVMSHEAAHVATDAAIAATPLWLLEGFADYVALRDVDLPLSTTAGQIAAQVADEGLPEELPDRAEFGTRTTHLGAAYEAAWLACRVLAEAAGEDALVEVNRRAVTGEDVDAVLRDVAGFGVAELTRRWRDELRRLDQGRLAG